MSKSQRASGRLVSMFVYSCSVAHLIIFVNIGGALLFFYRDCNDFRS
jgi:hypothetical protein